MKNMPSIAMAAFVSVIDAPAFAAHFNTEEATIPQIEQAFRDHQLTCHELVSTYPGRIAGYNKQGPKLDVNRPGNRGGWLVYVDAGSAAAVSSCR